MGSDYTYLYSWLVLWIILVLFQIHSTPANALILAYGKTKLLVCVSAIACIISIIINAILASKIGVGSSIIGYSTYIMVNLLCYYLLMYKKILQLKRIRIFSAFFVPTFLGCIALVATYYLTYKLDVPIGNLRFQQICSFMIKGIIWLLIYSSMIFVFKIVRYKKNVLKTFLD